VVESKGCPNGQSQRFIALNNRIEERSTILTKAKWESEEDAVSEEKARETQRGHNKGFVSHVQ